MKKYFVIGALTFAAVISPALSARMADTQHATEIIARRPVTKLDQLSDKQYGELKTSARRLRHFIVSNPDYNPKLAWNSDDPNARMYISASIYQDHDDVWYYLDGKKLGERKEKKLKEANKNLSGIYDVFGLTAPKPAAESSHVFDVEDDRDSFRMTWDGGNWLLPEQSR